MTLKNNIYPNVQMFKCLMVTTKHKLSLIGVSNNELGSTTDRVAPNLGT